MTDWHGIVDEPTEKGPDIEAELLGAAREGGEAPVEESPRMSRKVGLNFRATRAKYERHLKLVK